MRILFDASAVREGSGGMSTYLGGLLRGWHAAGFDDELVVLGSQLLPEGVPGLPARRGAVRRVGGGGPAARLLTQQLRLPRLAASLRPDVVLTADPAIPLWPLRASVVATVHDLRHLDRPGEFSRARRAYRRLLWGHGLKHADRLIANSDATAAQVVAACRSAADRVRTVHLGCDHVLDWPAPTASTRHAITFAHWSNKRPDFAIRVWGMLRKRHAAFGDELHVVGVAESDRKRLDRVAAAAGVGDLVRLHGFLADEPYRQLFSSARLVVMASTLEGFGFPVVEAMLLRIPVVASRGVGMEEAGGEYALYADPGSLEEFASQCERALFDPSVRGSFMDAAYEHASGFSWRRTAERVRAVLEEAAGL